jgi:CBS-domain-containing membrane protein
MLTGAAVLLDEPDATLTELVSFFTKTGLGRAIVLDQRRLAGIVSASDLIALLVELTDEGEPHGPD